MESLIYLLSEVVTWLAVASLKSSPLILLIITLRKWIPNALPATTRHYLWVSILLCLTIPLGWQINIDLNAQSIVLKNTDNLLSQESKTYIESSPKNSISLIDAPQILLANDEQTNSIQSNNSNIDVFYGLSLLWLLGASCLSFMTLFNIRKYHKIKQAAVIPSDKTLNLFETCKQKFNPGKNIRLLESTSINNPIVMGWVSPILLMPLNLDQQVNNKQLSYIFSHEISHVKRQDILFNWIVSIVNILHWFNPLIWFSSRLMRTDMEAACDALVLSKLPFSDRRAYGNTLIQLSDAPPSPLSISAVGILENHIELTERLRMIAKNNVINTKSAALVGLLLTASAAIALTQPINTESKIETINSATITNNENMQLGQLADSLEKSFGRRILLGAVHSNSVVSLDIDIENITYSGFLSMLKVNNFTAIELGEHIQIIPLKELRYSALPIVKEGESYPEDQFVTGFLTLKNACAIYLMPIIRPMAPQYAHMASDRVSNSMTVTDTYSNFKRIKDTVEKFDAQYDKKQVCKPPSPRKKVNPT